MSCRSAKLRNNSVSLRDKENQAKPQLPIWSALNSGRVKREEACLRKATSGKVDAARIGRGELVRPRTQLRGQGQLQGAGFRGSFGPRLGAGLKAF